MTSEERLDLMLREIKIATIELEEMIDVCIASQFATEPVDIEVKPPKQDWFAIGCDICHSPYQQRKS